MFLFKIAFLLLMFFSYAKAEVDKSDISTEEMYERMKNFDWKQSLENPIIEDNNANAFIDLRNFPYVLYIDNSEQVQQYDYWINGTTTEDRKYLFLIYPSEDENNNDRLTVYVDSYDKVGYVDGSDWENVDTDKMLKDQWDFEQKENKKKIAGGFDPIVKLEWFIKPTFIENKGYIYQSVKAHYEGSVTYNTWLYLLGRDGFQFISILFSEDTSKYVNTEFINKLLDSFIFEDGKSYVDFKEGDEVSSTSAADLVNTSEPELNLYMPLETLCIDVIKPTRDDIKMDELYEIITYSVASGFNMYDYMSGGVVNYNSSQEELLKDVSDYCKSNPSEPFLLAIFKTLMGDEN